MARRPAGRRAPAIVAWTSGAVAATLLVGGAVLAQGYDAQDLPTIETSVWVARDTGEYAQVNTDVAEISSVNRASGLAGVAQAGDSAFVFGSGWQRYWSIDATAPIDIESDASSGEDGDGAASAVEGTAVPDGATGVVANGQWCPDDQARPATQWRGQYILFSGPSLSWARSSALAADPEAVHPVDLRTDDAGADYQAAAAAISACGVVAAYSVQESERQVRLTDVEQGRLLSTTPVASAPSSPAGLQLAFVGGTWVLFQADADAPRIWIDGAGPYALPPAIGGSGLLQASGPASDTAVIASSTGLYLVSLADGTVVEQIDAAGVAARPVAFGDRMAAAWLTTGSGTLWISGTSELVALEIDGGEFPQNTEVSPELITNGDRAVLLERSTGMMWSTPDGVLIPLAQWTSDTPPEQGSVDVPDASQQEPPIAEDDAFGVRAGATAVLPVLFNDHDANQDDVLTIDPTSIEGLDPAFGTLSLVGANQTLVIRVTGAVPSASFQYRASDGASTSQPASVTLSLRTENTAPQWCDEYLDPAACHVEWPAPQIAVGGTGTFDVLKGWIDPEGDAMVVESAVPETGAPIVVMPTSDGRIAVAHDRSGSTGQFTVLVTVIDALGGRSAAKELTVTVQDAPDFRLRGAAVVGRAGEATQASVVDYASGGSGTYRVTDVTDISPVLGKLTKPDWNESAGTISLHAEEAGEYVVTYRAQDPVTRNEHTANLRYTVLPPEGDTVSVPPLTAFVRQGQDTLVDVLGAVQNTTGRVLLVTSAIPGPTQEGAVATAAAVIDNALIQIRSLDSIVSDRLGGRTDGPLGSITVTLADATGEQYAGTISVFLVPPSSQAPVAAADAATVRAGDAIDIAVLSNDVAPRGERLALSPDVSTAGDDAGLAFASGRTLRYLAPSVPGTYTVFYYAYLESSPGLMSRSQVTITVLPPGANRAPQAADLEARTLAGRSISIPIPVDAIDPDGDRVTISALTQPSDDAPGSVMVGDDGRSLLFYAPEVNKQQRADAGSRPPGWQAAFTYTVRDAEGETDTATVRVAVSTEDPTDLAPIVFTDHVRVQKPTGADVPVVVDPLRNDRDPAAGSFALAASGGTSAGSETGINGLHILGRVLPNMPGIDAAGSIGPGTPADAANALLDPTSAAAVSDGPEVHYPDGRVGFTITSETAPGTYTYLYTAESLATRSTAQGVIVVTVSEGAEPDRPTIDDTVVDIRTRSFLETGGIDVLTGRVVWPTGDPSVLAPTLAIAPGAPEGFTAHPDGRISGRMPESGAIVPFSVTGTDLAGAGFTTYGLLRIPPLDDLRLTVARIPDAVQETKSGEIDLAEILALGQGDEIEVDPASAFAIHRPSTDPKFTASCALAPGSASVLVYTAGYSPGIGSDTCTVQARLVGQSDAAWSTIVVPIPVAPLDPLAILTPITKTIPFVAGETEIDLTAELVTWTGGFAMPEGLVDTMTFSAPYAGGAFTVEPSGDPSRLVLSVNVLPTTPGGTREVIPVTLTYPWPNSPSSAPYSRSVNIVLYSGQPPPGGPVGATVSLRCDATAPAACQAPVVFPADQQGQYNPSAVNTSGAATALTLVPSTAECAGVGTVAIQGTSAQLTLGAAEENKPPGGICTVPFTVRDTLGRTGQGTINVEVNGYPQKPQAPTTNAVTRDSVTIDVVLGNATRAHPAVTAVRVFDMDAGGALAANQSCERLDAGAFQCTITGLAVGERHHYAARTVNVFGGAEQESAISGTLETWAFVAPDFLSPAPTYDDQVYGSQTSPNSGAVAITHMCVANGAADPAAATTIELTSTIGTLTPQVVTASETNPDGSACVPAGTMLRVGGVGGGTITAVPVSGVVAPPIGTGGPSQSGGAAQAAITSRGTPTQTAFTTSWDGAALEAGVDFVVNAKAGNTAPRIAPHIVYYAWRTGDAPATCTADPVTGDFTTNPGSAFVRTAGATGTQTFQGDGSELGQNQEYQFLACASWGYGAVISSGGTPQVTFNDPGAPTLASGTPTYTPVTADMSSPSIYSAPSDPAAPVFSWTIPSTPPTANYTLDAPSAPLPPGSTWQVRYDRSPSLNPYPATAPQDASGWQSNTGTWYAKHCFAYGGRQYCGQDATAITSTVAQSVGIDEPGSVGTVALPRSGAGNQCAALVTSWNTQVANGGQAAYENRLDQLATAARNAVLADESYDPYVAQSFSAVSHPETGTYTGSEDLSGYDASVVQAFRDGDGTSPGFVVAKQAFLDANPSMPEPQRTNEANRAGRIGGDPAAVRAGQQVQDDAADAAYASTMSDPAAQADAEGYRIPGTGSGDGEQPTFTSMQTSSRAAAAAIAFSSSGFTPNAPFAQGPTVVLAHDGAYRFTGIEYDWSTATPGGGFDAGYILDAIQASPYATYSCG